MDLPNRHRLLRRQLSRFNIDPEKNAELNNFINEIDKTYVHFEKELKLSDIKTSRMLSKMTESNQNLQNIIESIDGFNYHVSHDLKTSIINNISLTRMLTKYIDTDNSEKIDTVVNRLEKNSNSGLKLIEKYLEISKFESNISEAPKSNLNIKEYVERILNETLLKEKLDVTFGKMEFETLMIDDLSLSSMLQNFITNAFKYKGDDSPTLLISAYLEKRFKVLSFQDNGIGIDVVKNATKIFKPFVRVDSNVEGTGVGLFIVKKIITNLGGKIEVLSELKNGSNFIVKIPNNDE
jgi:signal transduction histidine kinase